MNKCNIGSIGHNEKPWCKYWMQANDDAWSFNNDACYKNGKKYGKVLEVKDGKIKIQVDNDNEYMKNQIVVFNYT